jgi:mercuric ion transport protein
MNDRAFIATGGIGAALAIICCATPLLAIVLGGLGLTAWLASTDYVVIAVLLLGVCLIGLGFYYRHAAATCRGTPGEELGSKS